jgi:hypothetical protein
MSPGALARLVEIAPSPAMNARLSEALRSSSSSVRAAAARVAFVMARTTLTAATAAAMANEAAPDAAFEEGRVVAYVGGAEYDSAILSAWKRLRVRQLLVALAGARRQGIFSVLPDIRESGVSDALLVDIIGAAGGGQAAGIGSVAASALRTGDTTILRAALTAAYSNRVTILSAVTVSALQANSDRTPPPNPSGPRGEPFGRHRPRLGRNPGGRRLEVHADAPGQRRGSHFDERDGGLCAELTPVIAARRSAKCVDGARNDGHEGGTEQPSSRLRLTVL